MRDLHFSLTLDNQHPVRGELGQSAGRPELYDGCSHSGKRNASVSVPVWRDIMSARFSCNCDFVSKYQTHPHFCHFSRVFFPREETVNMCCGVFDTVCPKKMIWPLVQFSYVAFSKYELMNMFK